MSRALETKRKTLRLVVAVVCFCMAVGKQPRPASAHLPPGVFCIITCSGVWGGCMWEYQNLEFCHGMFDGCMTGCGWNPSEESGES